MKTFKLLALPALLLGLYGVSAPLMANHDAAHKANKASKANKANSTSIKAPLPKIAFEKYTLPNGLTVILVEDHKLPTIAINMWYHVGPANEEPGLTGFAHLFEHMMFAATKHVPRGTGDKLFEAAGATDSNGSTSFDRTNYFDTVPSNQLELALWRHSDRMGYLLDVLDQKALTNQQDVVRNERRQRTENRPYGIVQEELFHQIFPKTHPYYATIIGSHADIQNAKLTDIKDFFTRYYGPNNASMVIAGDIDKVKTRALVAKYFGSFKRGPDVAKPHAVTPPITEERRAVVEDRVELPRVFMGWLTPKAYAPDDAPLGVAGLILGGGKTSRLYKSLVYDKQIAQDVSAGQDSNGLTSMFTIDVTARPGHTAQEIEAAIDAELQTLRTDGPTDAEVERAKNTIETGTLTAFEKIGGRGLADQLNAYNYYVGDPGYLAKDLERYRTVTAADVKRVINAELGKNARAVVHGVPGTQVLAAEVPPPKEPPAATGEVTSINADQLWRNAVPKGEVLRPFTLPKGQQFTLPNGLTVIHYYNPALPIVSAQLVVKSGANANPIDKSGLASFTAQMLEEGTDSRNAVQIAEQVAQLGAFLNTSSSAESSNASALSLTANFDKTLDLLADVVQHPAFPAAEIERQRASNIGDLSRQRENPQAIAAKVMQSSIYGDKHPFGYNTLGTESAIKSITRDDLQGYWKHYYLPNNAALIVSGDIKQKDLKKLVTAKFGAWKKGEVTQPPAAKIDTTAAHLVIIDKPGAPQTAVRIATLGPDRKSADYEALQVMNAALGGLFTSRLNTNIREDKGYSYGVGSGFSYRRTGGLFTIGSSVRTDVTGPAVSEMFKEVRGMLDKPMEQAELNKARNSQMLSLPGQFDTNNSISASMANIFIYDLGLGYYSGLPKRFAGVTGEAAQAAAKRYLTPENMIVISVGDKAKIAPQLEALKLTPVQYRDTDGNILK
jgi:zinc protease